MTNRFNIQTIAKRIHGVFFAMIVIAGFFLTGYLYQWNKGEAMYEIKSGAVNKAIPPIDAAAPGKTETATFALG